MIDLHLVPRMLVLISVGYPCKYHLLSLRMHHPHGERLVFMKEFCLVQVPLGSMAVSLSCTAVGMHGDFLFKGN